MTSRQRGATWLLALVLVGRVLDFLDLPFEHRPNPSELTTPTPFDSTRGMPDGDTGPMARPVIRDSSAAVAPPTAPLAINSADVRELQRLPRVGPVLAARIIAWREAHGAFRSLSDLQRVQGIGRNTAAQLAPLVRFD